MATNTHLRRALLFSGTITAVIVGVVALAYVSASAANKFKFVGRGIVRYNRAVTQTADVFFTHMSDLAQSLALGKIVEVHVGQAKIYKPDAAGKLHRVTQGNIAAGSEVTVLGNVRADDRFVARKIIVRSRDFSLKGKLLTYDWNNKRMTVQVSSTTYRPKDYNGGTVTIHFNAGIIIYHLGKLVEPKDVTASNQKVRVDGTVVNTDDFEATTMYENIK